jgi:hypothetical protein
VFLGAVETVGRRRRWTARGFERFLRVMPNEWRQNLERRAGGQMLSM